MKKKRSKAKGERRRFPLIRWYGTMREKIRDRKRKKEIEKISSELSRDHYIADKRGTLEKMARVADEDNAHPALLEAVPLLVEAMGDPEIDPEINEMLEYVLDKMGASAVPALIEEAENYGGLLVAYPTRALSRIVDVDPADPSLLEAIPIFLRAIREGGIDARRVAVTAIGNIAEASPKDRILDTLPVLTETARDKYPDIRAASIRAIRQTGYLEGEAADVVVAALEDPIKYVQGEALDTIARTSDPSVVKRAIPALFLGIGKWGSKWESHMKNIAMGLISKIAEDDPSDYALVDGVSRLCVFLRSQEGSESALALLERISLANCGRPEFSEVIPKVVELLEWREDERMMSLLAGIGAPAVPHLIEMLKNSGNKGERAKKALLRIGSPAIPPLIEMLDNSDVVSPEVLKKMGTLAIKPLVDALGDPRKGVRAARILSEIGTPAIPILTDTLNDLSKGNARENAAFALSWMEYKDLEVDDVVLAMLLIDHKISIERIGKAAVPALVKAFKREEGDPRKNAAILLGKMEIDPGHLGFDLKILSLVVQNKTEDIVGFGKDAIPGVVNALSDNERRVRGYAAKALRALMSKPEGGVLMVKSLIKLTNSKGFIGEAEKNTVRFEHIISLLAPITEKMKKLKEPNA